MSYMKTVKKVNPTISHCKKKKVLYFFNFEMMFKKFIVVISSWLTWVKPLFCTPQTYTVLHVNYVSIQLEEKKV